VYFSCKGKVISNQKKIQLYVYNNISYKTVPIRNFCLMGNNVDYVKWKWNHALLAFCYWQRTPCLLCLAGNSIQKVKKSPKVGSQKVQFKIK